MMGLHFMHEVPFRDVYIHALVRDEKGAKMSKSKGNVIDPLALIDNMALTRCASRSPPWRRRGATSNSRRSGSKAIAILRTKLWNAARFAEMNGCVAAGLVRSKAVEITLNRWIIGEAAKAIAEVTKAIRNLSFQRCRQRRLSFRLEYFL